MSNAVDTPIEWFGMILFLVCWVAGVASWVYALLELRWLRRGDPRAFRHGPTVLRLADTTVASHHVTLPDSPTAISHGVLVPLEEDCLGFSPRVGSLFHPLAGFRNLLLFKGVISWRSGVAEAHVRAPAGMAWFFLAFVTAWAVFGLFVSPSMECTVNGVPHPPDSPECIAFAVLPPIIFLAVGVLFAWGIRRRARALFSEVVSHVGASSGAA